MRCYANACLAALAVVTAGCAWSPADYEAAADREVRDILSASRYEAVGRWQESVKRPEPAKPPSAAGLGVEDGKPLVLSLRRALEVATERNRDHKTQRESVYLAALSLTRQRRDFGPIISNTLSYVYADGAGTAGSGAAAAVVGVSKVVPSGGTLDVSTGAGADDDLETGASTTYWHDVTVSFEQPLLKGFGREVAYEDLTQAERDVLYALRDFELFRQDFSIRVVAKYYAILRQKHVLENSRRNYERFTFLRKRSDELFKIGKVTAIDRFRAAQEELVASNDLIAEEEQLAALLDDFKVFLGLPTHVKLDIEDVQPAVKPVNIDLRSAIQAALHNRLDLKTSAQRVEDAERGVRIARNGLLPDLDLTASAGVDGARTAGSGSYLGSHSVGIALSLPFDKVPDRNTYRRAQITLRRRTRTHELASDNVKVEVMNTYRRLQRLRNSVIIETANVKLAEKRVQNAALLFDAGKLGNRDVVEAQAAKLRAQNALIRAILDYEIARLQLKRDIGILFIDRGGMWKE